MSHSTGEKGSSDFDIRSLGLELVPDLLNLTPAFVEAIVPDSQAAEADLQTDDLIVSVEIAPLRLSEAFAKSFPTLFLVTPFS